MNDATIEQWLGELASAAPAPGGGAAAALEVAMAAALVEMVCNLTIGKPAYAEHEEAVQAILDRASPIRRDALGLAAEDAAAFTAVIGAYRLPRSTGEEAAARSAQIQAALAAAADVPRRTAQAAIAVLELAEELAPIGNANVISDAAVAAAAARARTPGGATQHRRQPQLDRRLGAAGRARCRERADRPEPAPGRRDRLGRAATHGRMTLLEGRALAAGIRDEVAQLVAAGSSPLLAAVVADRRPGDGLVPRLDREGGSLGRDRLQGGAPRGRQQDGVLARLVALSDRPESRRDHLHDAAPGRADAGSRPASTSHPRKDVDGASPTSLGRLAARSARLRSGDRTGGDRAPPQLGDDALRRRRRHRRALDSGGEAAGTAPPRRERHRHRLPLAHPGPRGGDEPGRRARRSSRQRPSARRAST